MATKVTYQELVAQLPADVRGSLDELARQGARRMLAAALEAEVAENVGCQKEERGDNGRAMVVRNG